MIPLRDDIPSRTTPFVTYGLLVVNVAVYVLLEMPLGQGEFLAFLLEWGLIPAEVIQGHAVVAVRTLDGVQFQADPGTVLSLPERGLPFLTSMFLHGSFIHLAGNMLFLHIFGDNVEDVLGHGGFLVVYLACGLGAAFAQIALGPTSTTPMVGASGAIAGVLAGYMIFYPRARVLSLVFLFYFVTMVEVPAVVFLGIWFLFQFLGGATAVAVGASGGVAYGAHVGGFVVGGIVALLVTPFREKKRKRGPDALDVLSRRSRRRR